MGPAKILSEQDLFRHRVICITLVVALVFSFLAGRLWYLQVIEHEEYQSYAEGNRIRLRPEPGLRGKILDRNSQILAENRPAYHLQMVWEDFPKPFQTLTKLSETFLWPLAELKAKSHKASKLPFKSFRLKSDLTAEQAAFLQTYSDEFPGVTVEIEAARFYPYGRTGAHILGYIGATNKKSEELPNKQKRSRSIEGKAGLEMTLNNFLTGFDGGRQIEVDHIGRELRTIPPVISSVPGKTLQLTIDLELQKIVESAMGNKTGAVLVMNPRNGEILAMVSLPSYDPNWFVNGIVPELWGQLLNDNDHPLENKIVQGAYPPGSIFKLVTAYAALDQHLIDPSHEEICNGYFYVKGRRAPFKCWKSGGHGSVDLIEAIRSSCNVYFYQLAMEMGVDRLAHYAKMMMFGEKIDLGFSGEKKGLIPDSDWKRVTFKERWYPGETPSVAIGQGFVSVTPIQLANFVNLIASGGVWHPPKLLMDQAESPSQTILDQRIVAPLVQGMVAVVNDQDGGTANIAQIEGFTVAGKTGTAQIISHRTRKNLTKEEKALRQYQNHAWFAGFAPAESPEVTVLVLVEHGQGGARTAAPVARKILEFYHEHRYGRNLASSFQDQNTPFSRQLEHAFTQP
jgi:penicillin-binding protein 2